MNCVRHGSSTTFETKSSYCCVARQDLPAGREKEGEVATTSPEFEFRPQFPCGIPLTELSGFR